MDGLKLLIADSNAEFRLALADAFQGHCHVSCCRTGREALDILRSEDFDVFVLDLMLPELDGITLLEKAAAEGICLTVLATTPLLSDYVLEAAQRLGIGYLMRKPCDVQAAAARICDMSSKREPVVHRQDAGVYLREQLHDFAIPVNRGGYTYLMEAILLFAKNPDQSITKELYPEAAARCSRPGLNVERPIRTAIEAAWVHHNNPAWKKYFPNYASRPTNSEFIARLAEDLRQKFELKSL